MRKWLALVVFCGLAAPLMGEEVSKASKLNKIITEGEFAIRYCIAIQATEPKEGWTAESAIDKLTSLKVYHPEEWRPDADLVEGVMVELVHYAFIELVTPYPARKVKMHRANAMFHKIRRRLSFFNFPSFSTTFRFNDFPYEPRTINGEKATFIEL